MMLLEEKRTSFGLFLAAAASAAAAAAWQYVKKKRYEQSIYYVDEHNEPLLNPAVENKDKVWRRATYVLVMHDPPEMFYEPKEWSHTAVILCKIVQQPDTDGGGGERAALVGGDLRHGEPFVQCATRLVRKQLAIDVTQPENSLHHLFTFPYEENKNDDGVKRWGDFMECVYRGTMEDLLAEDPAHPFLRISLDELKDMVLEQNNRSTESLNSFFTPDSYYAIRLYFQRQGDLRAKRRLLKGYSSADLEHYGLREKKIVFYDDNDTARNEAVEFTMQTDDGMAPRMLYDADLVLLGVSRAGKTPISLILSQTMGLKVANIPLVVDMPPPPQLFKINPKRVFCLTVDEEQLKLFRRSRLKRELRSKGMRKKSTYADTAYVRRDLEHAQKMAHDHGFTEINVSGRAIEETASLIASKIKERFPDTDMGLNDSMQSNK